MELHVWSMFLIVVLLSVISPGPAILLAVSNGITSGLRAVCVAAFGNVIGLFILSTISILGLGVVLQTSATLFTMTKILESYSQIWCLSMMNQAAI